jgi:hypothetical protein
VAVTVQADSRELELLERWQAAERGSAAAERVAIAAELAAGAAERVATGAELRAEAALKAVRTAHDAYHAHLIEQRRGEGG